MCEHIHNNEKYFYTSMTYIWRAALKRPQVAGTCSKINIINTKYYVINSISNQNLQQNYKILIPH